MKIISTIKFFLLWISVPFQKLLQRTGHDEPRITAAQARELISVIKPGQIAVTFENGRPTSYLIPGDWDHAAIVSSKFSIVEAVGNKKENGKEVGGVREVDAFEFFLKKDNAALIDVIYDTEIDNQIKPYYAGSNSLSFIGRAYDYFFNFKNENIYCSELAYACYRLEDPDFLSHIPKDKEILPNDFYEMAKSGKKFGRVRFQIVKEIRNL